MRPGFTAADEDKGAVTEICKRLDGMPLAIELAAARVRALSLTEILDSLHDRFRLLTGGSRRAVRRQQSLEASVDWSHALLTEPERILFRRLSAFMGGFDLDAAQEVCGGGELPRHQILDQLTLLVDKSLVVAESASGRTRYRLLETIRQYAMEKLGESGEADAFRDAHRDFYTSIATEFDALSPAGYEPLLARAEVEIDNLRAAFAWDIEHREIERALELVSFLYPLWLLRARPQEGLAWFETAFADMDDPDIAVDAAVRARALADNAVLDALTVNTSGITQAEEALAIARELDDRPLLARALTACVGAAAFDAEAALPYAAEAIDVARELGDKWRLSQVLAWQAYAATLAGHPLTMAAAGKEGAPLAEAVGDLFMARMCRYWGVAMVSFQRGDVADGVEVLRDLLAAADASADVFHGLLARIGLAHALLALGKYGEARAFAQEAVDVALDLGPFLVLWAYAPLAHAALLDGDIATAAETTDVVRQWMTANPELAIANVTSMVELAFARGELDAARRWADEAVASMMGWHRARALTTRAHVAIAQSDPERAEVTCMTRSRLPAKSRPTKSFLTLWKSSSNWVARQEHIVKRRASSVRRTQSANGKAARFDSRSTSRHTPLHSPRFAMPWERPTSKPLGPKAQRCHSRRRSPMRSAVAASGSGRRRMGVPDADRARRRPVGQRGAWQQGHRISPLHLSSHGADAPDARLQQARHRVARRARSGGRQARLIVETATTQALSRTFPA